MENDKDNKIKPQDEENENIKNVVQNNKNRTQSEAALGSQNGSVNRFGVPLKSKENNNQDKENIKNKIDATKTRNLQESGNAQYIPNYGGMSSPSNGLSSYPEEEESKDPIGSATSTISTAANGVKGLKSGAEKLSSGAKKIFNKGTEKTAEVGNKVLGEGLKTGGKVAGKAASEGAKAGASLAKDTGKLIASAVSKIVAFLASVFGIPLLVMCAVIVLIIVVIVFVYIILSSYGQKFGIDSTNIEEFLREANVETVEGLTREEVDELLEGYVCKLSWWDHIRNFFGFPDLTDSCVNQHLIKKELEDREIDGDDQFRHGRSIKLKTRDELAPGYFFATLYYAFDTQNLNEEGEHYIPLVTSSHTRYNDDHEEIFSELITDLDAITTLLNSKKLDTCKGVDSYGNPTNCDPIYTFSDITTLLDNYIFFEDHHNDDANHGEGPYYYKNYKYGMPYWLYQYIIVYYDENGNPVWDWACVQQVPEIYYTDPLKFKLYLRYGQEVMDEYEYEKNWNLQWNKTDKTCRSYSGWTKWANGDIEPNGSVSLKEPPSLAKYETKANPDSEGNDNAKITISSGTYGYDSGFIYNTYPRYDDNYITVPMEYGYKVDKDIEKIIETIDSRQDYTNYFLGYESSVSKYISSIGNGSYNFNGGAVCTYQVNGQEVSDIKIRLLHARKNTSVPENLQNQPIEGQELIDFEKYILGVVYAEVNGYPLEVQKAQAIAAASWILASKKIINENGVNIIEISNSTWDQTYCDPDKGCDVCYSENRNTLSLYTKGTVPEGANCSHHFDPLPSDSPLRGAIKEVSGQILMDRNGSVVYTGYGNGEQDVWRDWVRENPNMDYVEIIQRQYIKDNDYVISDPDCSYGVTGEWSEWKQWSEEWKNVQIGNSSGINMWHYGCYVTCHAMVIAQGANNILIANFNPGTFAEYLVANNAFTSSGSLYPDRALDLAVGAGNWEKKEVILTGSYNYKVSRIAELLEEGYYVIIRVKSDLSNEINGAGYQHYVVVTGISGNEIIIADPGYNITRFSDGYINEGLTWAKGIKFK